MKKLLCVLIMLQSAVLLYGPGTDRDPVKDLENWLYSCAELTPENLKIAIDLNGIISADIIMAQSRLETGNYQSVLCTMYNNLFGMKKARIRPTTARGATDNNYATYLTWYDSVKDLKLFQDWYLSRGRDLTDYFGFLESIGYAEDPHYLIKVRELCITSI